MVFPPPLPTDAAPFLPHQAPIRGVVRIVSVSQNDPLHPGAHRGSVEVRIEPESLFADPDAELDPAALLELMAQAFAAISGYAAASHGAPPRPGYLAACRELQILDNAALDAPLRVKAWSTLNFGGFVVFFAETYQHERLLARGEFKVWLPSV